MGMVNNMMMMVVMMIILVLFVVVVVVVIVFVIMMVITVILDSINKTGLTQIFQFLKQSQKLEVSRGSERNAWLGVIAKSIVGSQLRLAQSNTAVRISQAGLSWFLAIGVASLSVLDNDDQKQQSNYGLHYARDGRF